MSHSLSIRENGFVEFGYTKEDGMPWHQLGNEVPLNSPLEVWYKKAGMDWEAKESTVKYSSDDGIDLIFNDKKVIYRSDTLKPLSTVSNKFKVVQPKEILDFFDDLISQHGMKMSAAGILFEGRRYWATAKTNDSFTINGDDKTDSYILLATSLDGSLCTTARATSIRTVCNNTLGFALSENGDLFRTSHRSAFDANQVKIDMGLMSESFYNYQQTIQKLAEVEIDSKFIQKFVYELIANPKLSVEDQPYTTDKIVAEIVNKAKNGIGNDGKTLYSILNGVTEYTTHSGKERTFDSKFESTFYGKNANLAMKAFNRLEKLVA